MSNLVLVKCTPRADARALDPFSRTNASLPAMDIAREAIRLTAHFLFCTLGLKSTFTEVGIGREHLAQMARKACGRGTLPGFKPLQQADIERIYEMCL